MALEMKQACEKCGRPLAANDEACICVYECTFCATCTDVMNAVCPNCGGELVRRPRAGKAGDGEGALERRSMTAEGLE